MTLIFTQIFSFRLFKSMSVRLIGRPTTVIVKPMPAAGVEGFLAMSLRRLAPADLEEVGLDLAPYKRSAMLGSGVQFHLAPANLWNLCACAFKFHL